MSNEVRLTCKTYPICEVQDLADRHAMLNKEREAVYKKRSLSRADLLWVGFLERQQWGIVKAINAKRCPVCPY